MAHINTELYSLFMHVNARECTSVPEAARREYIAAGIEYRNLTSGGPYFHITVQYLQLGQKHLLPDARYTAPR